jgi:hypothetical protein
VHPREKRGPGRLTKAGEPHPEGEDGQGGVVLERAERDRKVLRGLEHLLAAVLVVEYGAALVVSEVGVVDVRRRGETRPFLLRVIGRRRLLVERACFVPGLVLGRGRGCGRGHRHPLVDSDVREGLEDGLVEVRLVLDYDTFVTERHVDGAATLSE